MNLSLKCKRQSVMKWTTSLTTSFQPSSAMYRKPFFDLEDHAEKDAETLLNYTIGNITN
jgi:hypothetical protein